MLEIGSVGQISTIKNLSETYNEEIQKFVPIKGRYSPYGPSENEEFRIDIRRWGDDGQSMDSENISKYVSKFLRRVFQDESGDSKNIQMHIENNNDHLSMYFKPSPFSK